MKTTARSPLRMPLLSCLALLGGLLPAEETEIRAWLSTEDLSRKLDPVPGLRFRSADPAEAEAKDRLTIRVDGSRRHQTVLGLGSSLEPATCFNISRLEPASQDEVIARLFDASRGIGMNLVRICIGTPDFTGDPWYTYDDLPTGETDPELKKFSIEKDRRYILPVLKKALKARPELLFFASPWSPPGWMKSTGSIIGGRVLPEHYPAYARYFVRFVQAYEAEGIPLHAVTIQNEPGVDRSRDEPGWHYPSCAWNAEEERAFVRDHLGPAFRAAGLKTRIWVYDHNFNVDPRPGDAGIEHPTTVLRDPEARAFIAGVAFHGYEGEPKGMSVFHERFPEVPLHFTEGSVFGVRGALRLIEILRNHASSYNAWVTILDTDRKPNNGPFDASKTCVMLDAKTLTLEYRNDYYIYGQFMKFIERGAVRVESEGDREGIGHVAFAGPGGKTVLIVASAGRAERALRVIDGPRVVDLKVPARSVITLSW